MSTLTTTSKVPAHQGLHHLKLCVSDLERSAGWYGAVLGAHRVAKLDHRRPDGTLFSVILDVPHLPCRLELRLDPATARALDGNELLTLAVEDRAAMDEWIARLDGLGVRHSPPVVAMVGWVLVVPDPDGLRLRLYTTEPHGLDRSRIEYDSPWLSTGPTDGTAKGAGTVCAVARLRALPDGVAVMEPLLETLARATRQEEGCLAYRVHRAQDAPDTFVVYEEWADGAALTAHRNTAHMTAFREAAAGLVDGLPETELLNPCP